MKRKINWKNLSGTKAIVIYFFNILIFAMVFLFFGALLNSREEMWRATIGFTYREIAFCLLFAFLINGFLNFTFIIKPLWNMEDHILRYKSAVREEEQRIVYQEFSEDSIESVLSQLLMQQKLTYEKNKIEEKQRKKTELYALQSQIDPHFLYNALDSIRGYALLHDMEEISDITEALSKIFRNMISYKHEFLTLRQEVDNIDSYMKIQQFRFNNKFAYSFEVEKEMLDQYMVPRMVLQPLVENAILHGLEPKIEGGWVKVKVYLSKKRFVMTIIDNGVGISEKRLELLNRVLKMSPMEYSASEDSQHLGIALININKRIKLNFGSQYGITINSTPNIRTSSEVILPVVPSRR